MSRSERPSSRGFVRLVAGTLVPGGLFAASCVSVMSLEHRHCPCADGFDCCEATEECLGPGEACVAEDGGNGGNSGAVGSGGSGAAGRGGTSAGHGGSSATGGNAGTGLGGAAGTQGGNTSQGGASSGASGSAGDAGMAGVPAAEWQPVGPSPLDDLEARSEPDFELAPDGTPYLAFKSCVDCDTASSTLVPVIERFDGRRWRLLPTDGLPSEIVGSPALVIYDEGTPHVLIDGRMSRFDGVRWVAEGGPLPGPTTADPNFQIDQDGVAWVTLFDSARQEITVVHSLGDAWESWGLPVPGRSDGVHLIVPGMVLAHADADGSGVFVRSYMFVTPGMWVGSELAGESVDIAKAPDGTLYVAVWQGDERNPLGGSARLFSGPVDGLTEIGSIGSVSFAAPSLRVSTEGTLYAAFLVEDYVNVNRFDGESFRDVKSMDIGVGSSPALRLSATSSVPFVAFQSGLALNVKKYE